MSLLCEPSSNVVRSGTQVRPAQSLPEIRAFSQQPGYGCESDPTTERRLALRCMSFSPFREDVLRGHSKFRAR
jgi:hypothetical protein